MKKLTIFFLLIGNMSYSQSSFFAGLQTSINHTTLLNKEDRNSGEMYKSKLALSSAYSFTIGFSYKNKIQLFVMPNFMNFKHKMQGSCDTGSYNRLNGLINFRSINIPVMLGFKHTINEKLSMGLNAGIYYNQILSIKEQLEIGSQYIDTTWESVIVRTLNDTKQVLIFPDGSTYKITGDESLYKKINWGFTSKVDLNYALTDRLMLNIFIPFSYSFKDLENKKEIKYKYEGPVPGPSEFVDNYWEDGFYARYYSRPISEQGKRPATHTMALGLGLGINYHFNGGLLSKKLHD